MPSILFAKLLLVLELLFIILFQGLNWGKVLLDRAISEWIKHIFALTRILVLLSVAYHLHVVALVSIPCSLIVHIDSLLQILLWLRHLLVFHDEAILSWWLLSGDCAGSCHWLSGMLRGSLRSLWCRSRSIELRWWHNLLEITMRVCVLSIGSQVWKLRSLIIINTLNYSLLWTIRILCVWFLLDTRRNSS